MHLAEKVQHLPRKVPARARKKQKKAAWHAGGWLTVVCCSSDLPLGGDVVMILSLVFVAHDLAIKFVGQFIDGCIQIGV